MPYPASSSDSPATSEIQARRAVEQARLLADADLLAQAGQAWNAGPVLGLDTEFVRERTFRARPGLVQVSDGRTVWLVDAVRLSPLPPLAVALANRALTKVLHSVGEDLEVLQQLTGVLPEPLFDTQVAAAMLGMPLQCRYEHLVEQSFGVVLPGGKARNDWCRRPLAPDLLEYAAQDVIWLPELCVRLCRELERAGRLHWLEEDCQRIVEQARVGRSAPPLSRVKGIGRLPEDRLAVVDALARWREEEAVRRDLPRRFVVSDEVLVELAVAACKHDAAYAVSQLKPGLNKRYGDTLVGVMESVDSAGFSRPAWLVPLDNDQRTQLQAAQNIVRELAAELEVDPALIASKKELARLVRGEWPEWLDGWRGELLLERLTRASVKIPVRFRPGSSAG